MKIKGYVVRGKANDAPVFYVGDGDFAYADVGDGEAPKTLNTISDSSFAVESMEMDGCTDVRILAVHADGTEAPQPTYEEALAIVDLARRLIRSSDINTSSGAGCAITCDEEPYAALVAIFEAEREAERLIPGLACAECDQYIYRGQEYGGKGGHAAHKACRNWPKETVFKVAGAREGTSS